MSPDQDSGARAAPLFRHHPRLWQDNRFVYPVISRRSRGLSVGINLNPDQACNFDCVYCSVDRRVPPPPATVDLARIRDELARLLDLVRSGRIWLEVPFDRTPDHLRRFNDVAFSGDGEPTAEPQFAAACTMAAEVCEWLELSPKLVVITNGTLLDRPSVEEGLQIMDRHRGEVWAKLDAGTEAWFQRVDRSKYSLDRIEANLLACAKRRSIVIQSLFCAVDNLAPDQLEVDAWAQRMARILAGGGRIDRVQVYTTARSTAEASVSPLSVGQLSVMAEAVRKLGVAVDVFPAPEASS
jgi:wyosine [tRNA(Phe)-imidazoG37] synthetase (radical SAM superfamily)